MWTSLFGQLSAYVIKCDTYNRFWSQILHRKQFHWVLKRLIYFHHELLCRLSMRACGRTNGLSYRQMGRRTDVDNSTTSVWWPNGKTYSWQIGWLKTLVYEMKYVMIYDQLYSKHINKLFVLGKSFIFFDKRWDSSVLYVITRRSENAAPFRKIK